MSNNKINMSEIARLAGVSKATVSRVLNNPESVKSHTKQLVMGFIESTGYVKDSYIKIQVKLKKITIICLDAVRSPNSFYNEIIISLEKEMSMIGLETELFVINYLNEDCSASLDGIIKKSEAIIIVGVGTPAILEKLRACSIPVLIINGQDDEMRINSISPDYENGAFLATKELIKHGHTKIKIITANIRHSIYQRSNGFSRCMEMSNIDFSQDNIIDIVQFSNKFVPELKLEESIRSGKAGSDFGLHTVIDRMISEGYFTDTTAVFCICDMMAVTLMDALTKNGIRVPEDISIIGFDGLKIASMVSPKLTSIKFDYDAMCRLAVRKIVQLSNGDYSGVIRSCVGVEVLHNESIIPPQEK